MTDDRPDDNAPNPWALVLAFAAVVAFTSVAVFCVVQAAKIWLA